MLLTINNISKKYGKEAVVNNVSFALQENTCVALLGPNGAGKTTTLRILTGLIKQTTGTITFMNDKSLTDYRGYIGYLPQYPVFHNWMTGKAYLIYCAKLTNMTANEATERADELLEQVGIADAKNKRIGNYSGGMKQRLGIAQAIIHQPKLLILDEPVSALDPIGRREVLTLMEELKKEMTILFSTHILGDADEVSDELLLLHKGNLIESGTIKGLRKKYQTTMIELEFEQDFMDAKAILKTFPSVIDITEKRNILLISVTSITSARKEILNYVLEHDWPLVNFNVNRASLEDMFMKAVNN